MMSRAGMLAFCLLSAVFVGTAALAAGSDTAGTGEPASERFDFRTVLQDPAEWRSNLAAEKLQLERQLAATENDLDKAQASLAVANWLIGVPTARSATRYLLGLSTSGDPAAIAEAARAATTHLEKTQSILDKLPKSESPDIRQRRRELSQAAETLGAFVELFKAADLKPGGEAAQEAWRKAARGLAVARESQDADVAAAARLWQAFALDQAGKRDRAMEVLPAALTKPERIPYDMFSNLLRARLVAESGEYAASVTLLGRMEPSLKDWLANKNQDRNNARRLVSLMQYRILERWSQALRTATQPEAGAALAPLLQKIERSFAEVKSPSIYYMAFAVPLQIKMPAAMEGKAAQQGVATSSAAAE